MSEESQEIQETQEETQEETQDSVVMLASKMGWHEGGEKSAEQFIMDTVDINKSQRLKIGTLESKLDDLAANMTHMSQRMVAEARQKWEADRDAAIESGDKEKVREIDDNLRKIEESPKQTDPRLKILQESGAEFVQRNQSWWGKNRAATIRAQEVEERLLKSPPDDVATIYQDVEDVIKKEFPELYSNANRDRPSAVAGDRVSTARKTSWDKARAQDPEVESAFSELVRMGIYKDTKDHRERYAKRLMENENA